MNKLIKLITIPIIFSLLGYGLIYIFFGPTINIVLSTAKIFMSTSTSVYIHESRNLFNISATEESIDNKIITDAPPLPTEKEETNFTKTIPMTSITYPNNGDLYAIMQFSWDKVDVNLFFGDDMPFLRKGAGQYMGSFIPGYGRPILIAGHNSSYFKTLQNAKLDDIITIKTSYGTYEYKINDMRIYNANDKSAYNLSDDKEQLILYTCYPFSVIFGRAPKRYFIYADLLSGTMIDRTR